jgi:D-aminopeptidase
VWADPVFAGWHRLNGAGELTGLHWVRESGLLSAPIAITNTHSLGTVCDALIKAEVRQQPAGSRFSAQPVVGETYDGTLNDMNGFLIREEHVFQAVESASPGPVAEGNVGGGTGMICHGFKGGIGTSSRVVGVGRISYVVGVLVQANHGRRERLRVNGAPVGRMIPPSEVPLPGPPLIDGSIIVVVATDAPVLPHQCDRLAQRAALAIGRTGGLGEHGSGDLIVAFATGNTGLPSEHSRHEPLAHIDMLANSGMTALFEAVVDATEEAILNALLAAETMIGRDNVTAYRLPQDRLVAVLRDYSAM